MKNVRLICSRCRRDLAGTGPDESSGAVVCRACLAALEAEWGHPSLGPLIERLEPPVLVADPSGRLVAANAAFANLVGRDRSALTGLLVGEVVGCSESRLPQGCGHTARCPSCLIRRTICEVVQSGEERIGVVAALRGEAGACDLRLSARPLHGFVEVVLEELRAHDESGPLPPATPAARGEAGSALLDLVSPHELQVLQDAFAEATGLASLITDPAGVPLTQASCFCRLCREFVRESPLGLARCVASDAALGAVDITGPTIRACGSAGLLEAGTSICVGDEHVANWIIGQVIDEEDDEAGLLERANAIGADRQAYAAALAEVPRMPRHRFEAAARALFAFGRSLSTTLTHTHHQAHRCTEDERGEAEAARLRARLDQARRLETLGGLAVGADHDFTNVLTPILVYSQLLLEETSLDDPRRELIEELARAGQRAREHTRRLLPIGRPHPS
jgi:ligand-binding sensor protein